MNAHKRITSKVSYPTPQRGLNRGPKMARRHVNKKTAWWGQENAADNKMAKQNGDKQNYCVAGAQSAKNAARTSVLGKNKSQNGNKIELLSQRGKSYQQSWLSGRAQNSQAVDQSSRLKRH